MLNQDTDIENFSNNGYIIKRDFFDQKLIKLIYEQIQTNQKALATNLLKQNFQVEGFNKKSFAIENDTLKYLKNAQFFFGTVNSLLNQHLFNFAQSLTKSNIFLKDIELHQKMPGVSSTPPHQDNFYFCLKDMSAFTIYLALNDQDENSGVLEVIPKSHLKNFEHKQSSAIGFSSGIDESEIDLSSVATYKLNPGDIIVHHCNIIHLANPNNSDKPRSNLAFRFFPTYPTFDESLQAKYKSFLESSVRSN